MTHVQINGDAPIVFAIDTTASMNTRDAPGGRSRIDYARERIDEIVGRLPVTTRASVWTYDADVHEIIRDATATQTRAALQVGSAGGAVTNTGIVLERFVTGRELGTLVIVTDGAPHDRERFEAWSLYAERHEINVCVLAVGGGDAHGEPLTDDLEIRLRTRTQSDKPESERVKAPTMPPSLAPPVAAPAPIPPSDAPAPVPAPPRERTPPAAAHKPASTSHHKPTEHVDPRKHAPPKHRR